MVCRHITLQARQWIVIVHIIILCQVLLLSLLIQTHQCASRDSKCLSIATSYVNKLVFLLALAFNLFNNILLFYLLALNTPQIHVAIELCASNYW